MTTKFASIILYATISFTYGWEEFGLSSSVDMQPNRKRRMSSIWDEAKTRRQRIYRIREELVFEKSFQFESFMEMASFSMSMSMIPTSRPTASPVNTASPTMTVPSSGPTKILTEVPSDEPTASPALPTAVPSDEPTRSPVHLEPPAVVLPTAVPSDEPTALQPGASPSPTIDIAPSASLVPTIQAQEVSVEPSATATPTVAPTIDVPTSSRVPTLSPSLAPSQKPSLSAFPTESEKPSASTIPSSRPSTSPAPTLSPSRAPSQKPSVSMFPTLSQSPSSSVIPSSQPSTSRAPTLSPSMAPSQKPSISMFPTLSESPSSSGMPSSRPSESSVPTTTANPTVLDPSSVATFAPSTQGQVVPTLAFDCLENDILSLGEASDENTTGITLFVGYSVESSSNSTDDYLAELEQSLLLTAVAAALGCNRPDLRRRRLTEASNRKLLKQSTIIDSVPCNTTVEGAISCTTIETDLVFFLKGEVDPDRAAFSGYSAIRDKMDNDEYIGKIPTVLKIIYKSPLPLPAPPQVIVDQGSNNDGNLNARDMKLQVSPWTIGACVASVFGGAVSLLVWTRNRQSRHRRHIQLVEDCSMVGTSSRNPVSV